MKPFTSSITETIQMPHDPGGFVVIRKLAPRHLDAAQKESQRKSLQAFRDMGGVAVFKEIQDIKTDDKKKDEKAADPLLGYDQISLLQSAIVSWSYEEDPKNVDVLDDIDEDTRDLLARAILTLSRPRLFQTETEAETDTKNDSRSSTAV